jgi:hypothetical protein
MRFEVVQEEDAWVVRSEGAELARFDDQDTALSDVADRLRGADGTAPVSLAVRYQSRSA